MGMKIFSFWTMFLALAYLRNKIFPTGYVGVCVSEGQLHALVEHADVGSLESFLVDEELERPWLPWTLRTKLAADVAEGMTYLHSRGIFHRDLTSKVSLSNE